MVRVISATRIKWRKTVYIVPSRDGALLFCKYLQESESDRVEQKWAHELDATNYIVFRSGETSYIGYSKKKKQYWLREASTKEVRQSLMSEHVLFPPSS